MKTRKHIAADTLKCGKLLCSYAEKYETASFVEGDPSWFMHQVSSEANQEVRHSK